MQTWLEWSRLAFSPDGSDTAHDISDEQLASAIRATGNLLEAADLLTEAHGRIVAREDIVRRVESVTQAAAAARGCASHVHGARTHHGPPARSRQPPPGGAAIASAGKGRAAEHGAEMAMRASAGQCRAEPDARRTMDAHPRLGAPHSRGH